MASFWHVINSPPAYNVTNASVNDEHESQVPVVQRFCDPRVAGSNLIIRVSFVPPFSMLSSSLKLSLFGKKMKPQKLSPWPPARTACWFYFTSQREILVYSPLWSCVQNTPFDPSLVHSIPQQGELYQPNHSFSAWKLCSDTVVQVTLIHHF